MNDFKILNEFLDQIHDLVQSENTVSLYQPKNSDLVQYKSAINLHVSSPVASQLEKMPVAARVG